MSLSFSDLQKGGTLKQETIKDLRTGKNLKGCIYVQYSEAYQQYLYQYKEECDPSMGLWKAPVITVNGKTVNQKIRLEVTDSYIIPEGTAIDYEGNPVPVVVKGNVSLDVPGTYEIVYSATDSKGITGTLILTVIVYDSSVPTIEYVIEGTKVNGYYASNVTVVLSGLDRDRPVKRFEYRINTGNGYQSWNKIETDQFEINAEGQNIRFQVRSRNDNGNLSEMKESEVLKIDKTKPIIKNIILNPKTWTSNPIMVIVEATDNISGIEAYSFDEGLTWQSSSEKSFIGNQEIKVMVKDKAGNTSISNASSQITIDKYESTKPTIEYQAVGTPFNSKGWATSNFYLNVISHVGKSGIKSFQYCISNNGSNCTPNIAITNTSQAVQITSESINNKICSVVVDNADQSSGVVCSNPYRLDKTAPNFSGLTIEKSGTTYNGLNTTLTITGSDNLSSIEMNISASGYGKGSWQAYSKTKAYNVGGTLDGKVRTVYVQLRDQAGHISNKTVTYTVYKEGSSTTNKNYSAWSSCSKTCGGGTQSRTYQVVDNNTGKVMSTKTQSQACNTQSCNLTPTDIVNQGLNGGGLEKMDDGLYHYRGSNPNNYIKFNDELWRIISIDNKGVMKITRSLNKCYSWDSKNSNKWSRPASINTYLNDTYYSTLNVKAQNQVLQNATWNTGIISITVGNSGLVSNYSVAKLVTLEKNQNWNGKVGLPNVSDYAYAFKNMDCQNKSLENKNCNTENWMNFTPAINGCSASKQAGADPNRVQLEPIALFQLSNAIECLTRHVIYQRPSILGTIAPNTTFCNYSPVVQLKSTVIIAIGGKGTEANPYVLLP